MSLPAFMLVYETLCVNYLVVMSPVLNIWCQPWKKEIQCWDIDPRLCCGHFLFPFSSKHIWPSSFSFSLYIPSCPFQYFSVSLQEFADIYDSLFWGNDYYSLTDLAVEKLLEIHRNIQYSTEQVIVGCADISTYVITFLLAHISSWCRLHHRVSEKFVIRGKQETWKRVVYTNLYLWHRFSTEINKVNIPCHACHPVGPIDFNVVWLNVYLKSKLGGKQKEFLSLTSGVCQNIAGQTRLDIQKGLIVDLAQVNSLGTDKARRQRPCRKWQMHMKTAD